MKKREIRGLQNTLQCIEVMDSVDYPGIFARTVNAAVSTRNSIHGIETIDPAGDIT